MCPDTEYRKSLAVYYLVDAPEDIDTRGKALFAPTAEQAEDQEVLELIKRRASTKSAATVYE